MFYHAETKKERDIFWSDMFQANRGEEFTKAKGNNKSICTKGSLYCEQITFIRPIPQ